MFFRPIQLAIQIAGGHTVAALLQNDKVYGQMCIKSQRFVALSTAFVTIHTPYKPRTLGYGFDDGPNCSHNAFYDFLSSNNQRAS